MEVSDRDFQDLRQLEEGLWRPEVRFSQREMEEILAPIFLSMADPAAYTPEQNASRCRPRKSVLCYL